MSAPAAQIAYGKGRLALELDPCLAEWHVISPRDEPALPDPHGSLSEACRSPIASPPLRDRIRPRDRVVLVTCDGTRPLPNHLLIPWLIEELAGAGACGLAPEQVTVLLGTGTHRPNTAGEIERMFGAEVARRVRIVNHDAFHPDQNEQVGTTRSGVPVFLDKTYVRADRRIAVGFIEPHFFAGFSGGAKAIAPGVASIETILALHSYGLIADPRSTWGVLEENPIQGLIAEMVALCPPDFLVNVTLNREKAITAFFAGDYRTAHRVGCAHVRARAMVPVPRQFPLVVTSNSGYPLDQNLYQSVKGVSAAARIVQPGGTVIIASECSDGVPAHGNFGAILQQGDTIDDVDARLRALPSPVLDQWEAQVLVQVRKRCEVALYSQLDADTVRACKLTPVEDLNRHLAERIRAVGIGAPVAVLPEGPLTIPYAEPDA